MSLFPFHRPQNRLAQFFPIEAAPPPPPDPRFDKLIGGCYGIKLELVRVEDDDGGLDTLISYEVHGQLGDDDRPLLAALLDEFAKTPRQGGEGVAHD